MSTLKGNFSEKFSEEVYPLHMQCLVLEAEEFDLIIRYWYI